MHIVSSSLLSLNNNNAEGVSCVAEGGANNSPNFSGLGNLVVNSAGPSRLGFSPSALREKLRRFQSGSQARSCGTRLNLPAVLAHVPSGASDLVYAVCGGESTCRSPRCPKCRLGLLSGRSTEIQYCIDRYLAQSPVNWVSMLTLTAPHYVSWSLARFLGSTKSRQGIRGAVALLKERKSWARTIEHFVSGLEITYGQNGWHAHFHILVFHSSPLDTDSWISDWQSACLDAGLGRPSPKFGLTIQSGTNAARYISKWSLASEAVGGSHHKIAKKGGLSIGQIEQLAAAGDNFAQRKLLVYNKTTLRARWHNFSRSLSAWRKEYNSGRPAPLPLLVFDAPSSAEILQDSSLRALIAEVCSAAGADDLEGLPSAFGLAGEVPENPDLVWMSDPTRRAWSEYNRCLAAGLEQDASMHWLSYEFYLGKSIESSQRMHKKSRKKVPARPDLNPFRRSNLNRAWAILENKQSV